MSRPSRWDVLPTAVLTPAEVADLLGACAQTTRRFLLDAGLIHDALGTEFVVWEAVTRALAGERPVVGWNAAANVLGVSRWTLTRQRNELGDASRAWWPSVVACREWYAHLQRTPSAPAVKTRTGDVAAVRFSDLY